jgi:hypothetical protein
VKSGKGWPRASHDVPIKELRESRVKKASRTSLVASAVAACGCCCCSRAASGVDKVVVAVVCGRAGLPQRARPGRGVLLDGEDPPRSVVVSSLRGRRGDDAAASLAAVHHPRRHSNDSQLEAVFMFDGVPGQKETNERGACRVE